MKQKNLELKEYLPLELGEDDLDPADGERIWRSFGDKIRVEFPTPATGKLWKLTSQGWVGYLPVREGLALSLQPRFPLSNVFRMWEYAYGMRFSWFQGLMECRSIREFYSELAGVLAKRVLDLQHGGLFRAYVEFREETAFVRGRMEVSNYARFPWRAMPTCTYDEHTADVVHNRIPLCALDTIMASGLLTERHLPTARSAQRFLRQHAKGVLPPGFSWERIAYSRLNQGYEELHRISRFFIDQVGPTHNVADTAMVPFAVDMAQLYEGFVASWLAAHLPRGLGLRKQESVTLGGDEVTFRIDMVLYDESMNMPLAVLDTKYKPGNEPVSDDVGQIIAYAQMKGCNTAFLIYPTVNMPGFSTSRAMNIRRCSFRLDGDLERAGHAFMEQIIAGCREYA